MLFLDDLRRGRRRRRSRQRARNAAVVLVLLGLLGVLGYELAHVARAAAQLPLAVWQQSWGGIERYEPAPDYRAARTVYPYSVVPGGVIGEAEFEASMAKDAVVARHYRDIVPARLLVTRLNAAVNVYALYRTANSVHWTTHTIRVPKGELILTDGAHMIRARCGNRLAFTPPAEEQSTASLPDTRIPQTPESPPVEPPELVFDYGMPSVFAMPETPPPPHNKEAPLPKVAHFWPPATEPPQWCCGPGGFLGNWHPAHPSSPGRPKPHPPGVPEPAAGWLLGTGVILAAIRLADKLLAI